MLNDAILTAATELSHLPRGTRKIIFVISSGYEYGSRASYAQVLKVLLTNGIAIYAVGVEGNAIPGLSKLDKLHIPGQGYTDILPKYANATGGDVIDSGSREAIETAYQQITSQARNQYTLGIHNATTRLEHLSRHRSAREASGPAGHREARILSAASAERSAGHSAGSGDHAASTTAPAGNQTLTRSL